MFIVVISLGWEIRFQRRIPLVSKNRRDKKLNMRDWMAKTIIGFGVFQEVAIGVLIHV